MLNVARDCKGITNNVSVNGLDKAGSTPLHWAARGGHMECAVALLDAAGIQVNVANKCVKIRKKKKIEEEIKQKKKTHEHNVIVLFYADTISFFLVG